MMIKKPFGKKVLSIILVIVITITPFSYVKADTYTIDDLYNALRNILIVLNGYGQNMPTDGINDQIEDLQDLFDTIFVDNTYSYVGLTGLVENQTFMQLLQVIADQGYSIPSRLMEGYYMRDQNGNLVHMDGINQKIADILSILNNISGNDLEFISYQLNRVLDKLTSIATDLSTVSSTLSSILSVDNNILTLETNFYNYIQNGNFKKDIDNAIDTITWNNSLSITSSDIGIRIDGTSNEYLNQDINLNNNDVALKLALNNNLQYSERLFKLVLPYYIYKNNDNPYDLNISIYFPRYGADVYYTSSRLSGITIYFRIDAPQPITNLYFKISGTGTLTYLPNFTRTGIYYIDSNDIEYWQLLEYMNLHKLLLDYESVNSSELDKLKQENTNLQTTITDFTNIETQITTNFSNNLVTFNSNLNDSSTLFGHITSSVVWFSQQMQNIFDVSTDFKMLLIMPMILGIALWFIGRGSFILRSSGKKGKESNKN